MAGKHALKRDAGSDERPDEQPEVDKPGMHPAVAPAVVTLVAIVLVVGIGWLNRSGEPGPASLAQPLADGQSSTSEGASEGDAASVRAITPSGTTSDAGVVTTRGAQAMVLPTWMDIPLVAPAIAVRPEAADTMIPGAEPTAVPPPGDSGSSSGSGSAGGTTNPTTAPTVTPSTVATATTQPTGTNPPTTVTPTTEPPTTEPPTTEPPTTEPPTTEPPPPTTEPPPPTEDTGLLDVVDDLLGDVTGLALPPA